METWATIKRENSRVEAMKISFFRAILNKIKNDRITNTNIRLELGVDEIKMTILKQF